MIQATTDARSEAPWQMVAQNRTVWSDLEREFIARATSSSARALDRVPVGRHTPAQSEEWL